MEMLWTRVRVAGPLLPHVPGFAEGLARQGYADRTVDQTVRLVSHLSRWLAGEGREVAELTPQLVEAFHRARRDAGQHARSHRAFAPLLAYLRKMGVTPVPERMAPTTQAEQLLEAYRTYLIRERGMVPTSVRAYAATARTFLVSRSENGTLDLEHLTPTQVVQTVVAECRRRRPGAARRWQSELRCLLRFLEVDGRIPLRLIQAVPTAPHWRGASLPRALQPDAVAHLLAACDRQAATGRRDFALVTLLARLGLRRQEVANLTLEDLDWRHGEITVRAKGRCEKLPLSADVGEALCAHLHDRPRVGLRNVFLTALAPIVGLQASGVGGVVRRASRRAGMAPVGAHRLRHTVATEMLCAGASLPEVSQVLRHQDLQTTAIYAKIDHTRLRGLAQPWPGGAR